MILQAYKLNGLRVGVDIQIWNPLHIPTGVPAFKWDNVLDPEYGDITSIDNIDNYGELTSYDVKFNRDQKKILVKNLALNAIVSTLSIPPTTPTDLVVYKVGETATGIWAGMEGKLARWENGNWTFYGTQEKPGEEELGFVLVNDLDMQINLASDLIGTFMQQVEVFIAKYGSPAFIQKKTEAQSFYKVKIEKCRKSRLERAIVLFHQHLPANAAKVLFELQPHSSDRYYYEQGYDGIRYGDVHPDLGGRGLADYIFGEGFWEGNGLKNQNWTSVLTGENMSVFHLYIADILFETGLIKE
jgi:hypothetical protein